MNRRQFACALPAVVAGNGLWQLEPVAVAATRSADRHRAPDTWFALVVGIPARAAVRLRQLAGLFAGRWPSVYGESVPDALLLMRTDRDDWFDVLRESLEERRLWGDRGFGSPEGTRSYTVSLTGSRLSWALVPQELTERNDLLAFAAKQKLLCSGPREQQRAPEEAA